MVVAIEVVGNVEVLVEVDVYGVMVEEEHVLHVLVKV
jgi:hypothetical protein